MKAKSAGDAAERMFQRALTAQAAGDFVEAERLYRLSMAMAPARSGPRHNLGALLRGLGRLEEARDMLEGVLRREPGLLPTRYALGMVLMGMGDYPAGWPLYEARRALPELKIQTPSLPFPEWQGEPLAGKRIVLFPEQGLGDNIQFARFALTLRDQGAQVLLLCRPPLERVLRYSLDGVEVQSASGTVEMGEPDYWALFGSLPGPLGLTLQTLPAGPYLRAPDAAQTARSAGLRIGLATRGNPIHQNDARRSLSPQLAQTLSTLPGDIVSLHPEDSGARDFADTARLIDGLDVVISVDTSVAHLAGAMGKPTLVLVPGFATDWRWLQSRSDSPWYRSVRLFRSTVDGDWTAAFAELRGALAELTKAAPPPT
jgi:hypothetical protein